VRSDIRSGAIRTDVVVIGAGAAGIAAARSLQQENLSVIVVEARKRIGGRIYTDSSLAPHPVERGAEFIHGSRAVTWNYVEQFGLGTIADANHGCYFLDGQLRHEPPQTVPFCERLMSWLKEQARAHLAAGGADLPISSLLVQAQLPPSFPSPATLARLLNHLVASEKGADLDEMSLSGLLEHDFSGYGEGNYRIVEGYARLLGCLARGLDIRLGMPVKRVEWSGRGAVVHARGKTLACRHVVVTLPLGVLQAQDVTFDPELPAGKQAAIERLGAAAVCKLFLRFRERFWPEDMAVLCTTGRTQVWWPTGWGRSHASPLLTALVGGDSARRFAERKQEALPRALRQIEEMFGARVGKLFLEGKMVRWHCKRYTRMGYSYLPVGAPPQTRDRLAEPIRPTLFFAGEATNSRQPSTVHGALESGNRAAQQLLEVRQGAGFQQGTGRFQGNHSTPPRAWLAD